MQIYIKTHATYFVPMFRTQRSEDLGVGSPAEKMERMQSNKPVPLSCFACTSVWSCSWLMPHIAFEYACAQG